MQELIDALTRALQIDARQASGGAAILFKAARDKMGPSEFAQLLGNAPGVDQLIAQAPDNGSLGKLFGGFASALGGGNAAIIASIVTGFGRLGLTQEHAKGFVPVILDYLRGKIGPANTDKLEKVLRA